LVIRLGEAGEKPFFSWLGQKFETALKNFEIRPQFFKFKISGGVTRCPTGGRASFNVEGNARLVAAVARLLVTPCGVTSAYA
jgi:hypothetical protein